MNGGKRFGVWLSGQKKTYLIKKLNLTLSIILVGSYITQHTHTIGDISYYNGQ